LCSAHGADARGDVDARGAYGAVAFAAACRWTTRCILLSIESEKGQLRLNVRFPFRKRRFWEKDSFRRASCSLLQFCVRMPAPFRLQRRRSRGAREFNSKKVSDARELRLMIGSMAPGTKAEIEINREGQVKKFDLQLAGNAC